MRHGHFAKQCKSLHHCRKCQNFHHTPLHVDKSEVASIPTLTVDTNPVVPVSIKYSI